MIRTHEFAITQGNYIQFSMLLLARNWAIVYFALLPVLILAAILGTDLIIVMLLFLWWLAMPLWFVASFALQAYSARNAALFRNHYFDIDAEFITMNAADGTVERYPLNNIVKVITMFNTYLLFTSTSTFYLLPYRVFQSESDHQNFNNQLVARGLRS